MSSSVTFSSGVESGAARFVSCTNVKKILCGVLLKSRFRKQMLLAVIACIPADVHVMLTRNAWEVRKGKR